MNFLLQLSESGLFPFVGVVVSVVALAFTVAVFYRRLLARDAYLNVIRHSAVAEEARRVTHAATMSQEQRIRLEAELERLVENLDEQEKAMVLEGLHQSSARGRDRYVDRILEAA